jgi:hypothetical protein
VKALTSEVIEELASQRNVRRIAVENFLGTMPEDIGAAGNLVNLMQDALSYNWGKATVDAIVAGICLAFDYRLPLRSPQRRAKGC